MKSIVGLLISLCVFFLESGCALLTHNLSDPNEIVGINARTTEMVTSLRCEVITFMVENRLREQIWKKVLYDPRTGLIDPVTFAVKTRDSALFDSAVAYVKQFPFVRLDPEQFSALSVDIKNINTAGLNVQNDWKNTGGSAAAPITRTYHVGPAIGETNTFEYLPPLAIAQNADLGPTIDYPLVPGTPPHPAARYSTAYYNQAKQDETFFCYKSLSNSAARELPDVVSDIQKLVVNDPEVSLYVNFKRVYVGRYTLAQWFQNMAEELNANQHTIFPTSENAIVGQIGYSFTLDIKPSIDLKYTYVAQVINPFVPDLSGSIEHSSQFSIYLNTEQAVTALTAKTGNSCNVTIKDAKCAKKKS